MSQSKKQAKLTGAMIKNYPNRSRLVFKAVSIKRNVDNSRRSGLEAFIRIGYGLLQFLRNKRFPIFFSKVSGTHFYVFSFAPPCSPLSWTVKRTQIYSFA